MTTFSLNQTTRQMVAALIDQIMSQVAGIVGSVEVISGCPVVDVDPDGVGVGTFPRNIQLRVDDYIVYATYRGGMTVIAVGSTLNVIHFREGDLYEVLGPGGSTGSSSITTSLDAVVIDSVSREVVVDTVSGTVVYVL